MSDILVKIVLNDVPIVDILSCVTSPVAAKYPNSLSIEIPALLAVTATSDIPSASPPAFVADSRSTAVNLSTIPKAFSASTL